MDKNIIDLIKEIRGSINGLKFKIKHTDSELKIKFYYDLIDDLESRLCTLDLILYREFGKGYYEFER